MSSFVSSDKKRCLKESQDFPFLFSSTKEPQEHLEKKKKSTQNNVMIPYEDDMTT